MSVIPELALSVLELGAPYDLLNLYFLGVIYTLSGKQVQSFQDEKRIEVI